jgi:hypothetical protein
MLPLIVVVGQPQEGRVKENVLMPPENVTVSVNDIVVPHTNAGEVLTEKGTVFVAEPFSGVAAYGEFGWLIVTPGVELESTAETFEPVKHPSFFIVTFKLLHSSRSMVPLPSPPETALDAKTNFAAPVRHWLSVVVWPSVMVTIKGPAAKQS